MSLTLIEPAIQESVKAITAKYTAEQLVTKRAEVKVEIQEAINNFISITLAEKGISTNALRIANIAITDFDFSDEFNKAIELKVKAEQEALQAKNEKIRRVDPSRGRCGGEKACRKRPGFRDRSRVQGKGPRRLRGKPMRLRTIRRLFNCAWRRRWDGTLPKFSGGNTVPLLNVDSLLKEE